MIQKNAHTKEPDPKYFKKSTYNLFYLKKLVGLCREKNIKVYFVRSPLYKNSFYQWNEPLFQAFREEEFPEIRFLDFKDFNVPNDHFRDLDHLNHKGAEKFSQMFND